MSRFTKGMFSTLTAAFFIPLHALAQQPGTLDASFSVSGLSAPVRAVAAQADGKILVGSDAAITGAAGALARLMPDGSADPAFQPPAYLDVRSIAVQSDGKILVYAGRSQAGAPNGREESMWRLNADGMVDASFQFEAAPRSVGGPRPIHAIHPFPGGIYAQGDTFIGVLNEDGSARSYGPPPLIFGSGLPYYPFFNATALHSGTNLVAGAGARLSTSSNPLLADYVIFNPALQREFEFSVLPQCVRCDAEGTPRSTEAQGLAVQPDGQIVFNGKYSYDSGFSFRSWEGMARLRLDGSLDPVFAPASGGSVGPLAVQPDGKIVLAGTEGLVRLNSAGGIDHRFEPTPAAQTAGALGVRLQMDGNILLWGTFTNFHGRSFLARVRGNDGAPLAPSILSHPASEIVPPGSAARLSVEADGTALNYQWSKQGAPIAGATNAAIALTNVTAGDAGSYSVTVSNSLGVAQSNPAMLEVGASSFGAIDQTPEAALEWDLFPVKHLHNLGVSSEWFAQTNSSVEGGSALRAGRNNNMELNRAGLSFMATGPGTLIFWTKTPSASLTLRYAFVFPSGVPGPPRVFANENEWTRHEIQVEEGLLSYVFSASVSGAQDGAVYLDSLVLEPEMRISEAVLVSPGVLELTVVAAPYYTLMIETSANLADWSELKTVEGFSNPIRVTAPGGNAPAQYFRLRRVQ